MKTQVKNQQALVKKLNLSAEWRARKVAQFPDDDRNIRAEMALTTLAREVAQMEPDDPILLQLERACAGNWSDVLSEQIRRIGFRVQYRNARELVAALVRALEDRPGYAPTGMDISPDVNPYPPEKPTYALTGFSRPY